METTQTFHPETISRQGERNAWLLTGFAVVTALVLTWRLGTLPVWAGILAVFLLLSACLISLSNWNDRKTMLSLSPESLTFHSGLRRIDLPWPEIKIVRVNTDNWGRLVQVSGGNGSFKFRMLSDLEFQGKVRGQMGFAAGESILNEIIKMSGLSLTDSSEQGHYYARP